jgi:hypothetical protein
VWMFLATMRTSNTALLVLNTVQLVILVEVFFYGVLPNGLILTFPAAALAMRELRQRSLSPPPSTG